MISKSFDEKNSHINLENLISLPRVGWEKSEKTSSIQYTAIQVFFVEKRNLYEYAEKKVLDNSTKTKNAALNIIKKLIKAYFD